MDISGCGSLQLMHINVYEVASAVGKYVHGDTGK